MHHGIPAVSEGPSEQEPRSAASRAPAPGLGGQLDVELAPPPSGGLGPAGQPARAESHDAVSEPGASVEDSMRTQEDLPAAIG